MGLLRGLSLSHVSPPHALIASHRKGKSGANSITVTTSPLDIASKAQGIASKGNSHAKDQEGPMVRINQPESNAAEFVANEDLDLMYDPMLNCYYDPKTNKYYELA